MVDFTVGIHVVEGKGLVNKNTRPVGRDGLLVVYQGIAPFFDKQNFIKSGASEKIHVIAGFELQLVRVSVIQVFFFIILQRIVWQNQSGNDGLGHFLYVYLIKMDYYIRSHTIQI